MKALIFVFAVWALVFAAGIAGLFSGQPILMGVCLVAWTPVVFAGGWYSRASGLSISVRQEPTPKPQRRTQPTTKKRVRQFGD